MSLVDAFTKEDRTVVKFQEFFALVKQAAQYETVMNAVNCDVPHRFIRETMTGKKEEVPEKKGNSSGRREGRLRRGRVQTDFTGNRRSDRREVRESRGRSRTGAGSTGKRTAGSNRGKYSGRRNRLQRVERRINHGSNYYFIYCRCDCGNNRPCGLRRTPCEQRKEVNNIK